MNIHNQNLNISPNKNFIDVKNIYNLKVQFDQENFLNYFLNFPYIF